MSGRPIKRNADYFPHENGMRNDRKLKAVRAHFGLGGYAVYNMLLESITEADLLQIKFDDIQVDMISGDFGVNSAELIAISEYLIRINLLQKENGYLKCAQLEKRLSPVFEHRKTSLTDLRNNFLRSNSISDIKNSISTTEIPISVSEIDIVKKRKGKESKKENIYKEKIPFEEIIKDLNEKSGKNYRVVDNVKKLIKARFNEGYNSEDFKKVHTNQCRDWKENPEYNKYLRPSTLYRPSHFDSYLNNTLENKPNDPTTLGRVI